MKNSIADKFHDSLSEFHYPTNEAEVSGSDLKNKLYYRLSTKLQELTIPEPFNAFF